MSYAAVLQDTQQFSLALMALAIDALYFSLERHKKAPKFCLCLRPVPKTFKMFADGFTAPSPLSKISAGAHVDNSYIFSHVSVMINASFNNYYTNNKTTKKDTLSFSFVLTDTYKLSSWLKNLKRNATNLCILGTAVPFMIVIAG